MRQLPEKLDDDDDDDSMGGMRLFEKSAILNVNLQQISKTRD